MVKNNFLTILRTSIECSIALRIVFTAASYNLDIGDVNIGGKLTLIQRYDQLTDDIENTHNFEKNWLYATPRFTGKMEME